MEHLLKPALLARGDRYWTIDFVHICRYDDTREVVLRIGDCVVIIRGEITAITVAAVVLVD